MLAAAAVLRRGPESGPALAGGLREDEHWTPGGGGWHGRHHRDGALFASTALFPVTSISRCPTPTSLERQCRFGSLPEPIGWPARGRRIAGVSAFGMGGTNAHIVSEEAPAAAPPVPIEERPAVLVSSSSARSLREALRQLAARYEAWLARYLAKSRADVCFTAGTGRRHFVFRAALVAQSAEEARPQLAALAEGRSSRACSRGKVRRSR